MDTNLLLMTGADYPILECQLTLHQPTIEEISLIGEEDFFSGIQTLAINKTMFEEDFLESSDISNFDIFITLMNSSETVDKKNAVLQILNLLLPLKKISFTQRSILFIENNSSLFVDKDNFIYLQNAIMKIFCLNNTINDQTVFDPINKEAKKIAEKLMKGRKKIIDEKGNQSTNIFATYLSVLSIGLNLPLNYLIKYTVYQIYDTLERYGLYIDWDIDIKVRLAGGEGKQQPENWMKNIH